MKVMIDNTNGREKLGPRNVTSIKITTDFNHQK